MNNTPTPRLTPARHTTRALWLLLVALAVLDVLWLAKLQIVLIGPAVTRALYVGACLLGLRLFYTWLRPEARICAALDTVVYVAAFSQIAAILSYLIVGTGAPLVDAWYARADAAIGFNWLGWFDFVHAHTLLAETLRCAYGLLLPEMIPVVLVLAFSSQFDRLRIFVVAFSATALATLLISAVVPAAGAWIHYGLGQRVDLAQISDFELLRRHQMAGIDLARMQGLISMPSFHAALAVLYAWSMRRCGAWFWPCALLNALIVLSALTEGGHYLVDVVGGTLLASIAIGWTLSVNRQHEAPQEGTGDASSVPGISVDPA